MKRIVITLILFVFILLLINVSFFTIFIKSIFNKDTKNIIYSLVYDQYNINERLYSISNNNNYTLDEAYIEINPYKLNDLSAIIIFQTNINEEIEVYINDEYKTTMEKSNKHIIPIYGLKPDYDNIIKLKSSTISKEYIITTKDIHYNNYFNIDEIISNSILDNNNFIIKLNKGYIEIDHIGKIYNYYIGNYYFNNKSIDNYNIYLDNTKNIDIAYLEINSNIENTKLNRSFYKFLGISKSKDYKYCVELTNNYFYTDYDLKEEENIKLYFMNKFGIVYILDYHKNMIFNINLPKDKYALFIKIENTVYNTNNIYEFK
ncbi:MAG: hypothetical protein IJ572_02710 [Bacilli bacterium]|nr:hypothetical protein [Bacilli bacterium]